MRIPARYNEISDVRGPRPAYANFSFPELSPRPFLGSAELIPFPLLLEEQEYQRIARGARQRSRVLQVLFQDLILGEQKWLKENGGIVPSLVVERLIASWHKTRAQIQEIWQNRGPEDIRVSSGPDLLRCPDGIWRVLEDNMGGIGGRTSSFPLLEACRAETAVCNGVATEDDFVVGVKKFLARLGLEPGDERVVGMVEQDKGVFPDNESFAAPLRALGIKVLVKEETTEEDLAAFYSGQIKAFIPITLHAWPKGKKDLFKLFASSEIAFYESPLVKMVGDKSFLPYMGDLVPAILGEECALPSIHSEILLADCEAEPLPNSVYKITGNATGVGVFIVDDLTDQTDLRNLLREYPSWGPEKPVIVRQKRERGSVLEIPGQGLCRLEMRFVSHIHGWDAIHVSENPTAYVLPPRLTDSRNHVSRGAYMIPTIRRNV